ncbi:hypothetical protein J6590_065589 [Homalodisca vitripennis]|nr:hypothetical protein J6590_065589 [Homalodisca vitripennis]
MIWFCRIVGGLPLESPAEIRGIEGVAFSITAFLWSAALVVLQEFLSSSVLYMYFMDRQIDQTLHPLNRTADVAITLQVTALQVTAAVVFLSSARKYPRLVDVLDTLERVYRDHQCKTSEVKVTVKFWGMCTTIITLAMLARLIQDGGFSGRQLPTSLAFVFMLLLYCSEVSLFVHFTHVTQIIAKCFRMVNARIQKELIGYVIERMEINSTLPLVDVNHADQRNVEREKKRGLTFPSTFLTNHSSRSKVLGLLVPCKGNRSSSERGGGGRRGRAPAPPSPYAQISSRRSLSKRLVFFIGVRHTTRHITGFAECKARKIGNHIKEIGISPSRQNSETVKFSKVQRRSPDPIGGHASS